MSPLTFYQWEDKDTCICTIVLPEKLTDSELKDIVNRKMKIRTDKGIYQILDLEEYFGGALAAGGDFRSYAAKVLAVTG
jgi:hypothetical protein